MDKAAKPSISRSNGKSPDGAATPAFRLADFHYDLPEELIAQAPLPNRSDSRMMVLNATTAEAARAGGQFQDSAAADIQHASVRDLPGMLKAGDHLVFNNTRVIPARLYGSKASGGKLEMMLERVGADGRVLAKIRASKSPKPGTLIILAGKPGEQETQSRFEARVTGRHDDLFELEAAQGGNEALTDFIAQHGDIPLPPYIERAPDQQDAERYQTVFARSPGAVAAPTAGLHFDEALLKALEEAGISHSFITLHVGAGTFQPVRVEDPAKHVMHAERVSVDADTVDAINRVKASGGRVVAVGTTSVRALEAAAAETGELAPYSGETRLFLVPGSRFHVIDGMVTNFHLPESTLLMLVASFAGLDTTLEAYRQAVRERYRFFSYGDAMLVWPQSGVRA